MSEKTRQNLKKKLTFLILTLGFCAVGLLLTNVLLTDVTGTADTAQRTFTIAVANAAPTIASAYCCFVDTGGTFTAATCKAEGGSFAMTPGTDYDMVCNFTMSDTNGWQDFLDSWVNATWFHSYKTWNTAPNNNYLYTNNSCRNITGTETGNDQRFACWFKGIKFYADGGTWYLLINTTDTSGTNQATDLSSFTISNTTGIWVTSTINFGTMNLADTGSQFWPGKVAVNATVNNTSNHLLNVRVDGAAASITCSIGTITIGNVKYDVLNGTAIGSACGTLTSSSAWSGCSGFLLQNCQGTCPASLALKSTYWGITIPGSAVGGTCNHQVTFTGIQGPGT